MRLRYQALLPFAVAIGGFLSSPSFLALLPATWSHIITIAGILVQTITPALVTDKTQTKV